MTTIAVLPNPTGMPGYRAVAGGVEVSGATLGEAIDAAVSRGGTPTGATLILVQPGGADEFFTGGQQARLAELMDRWRQARDTNTALPAAEQAELDGLIAAELRAATQRTAALLRAARP